MSPVHPTSIERPVSDSSDDLDRGIVDLYTRRMAMVADRRAVQRQEELDQIVVTEPFGRAFTAQPSYPPDPSEALGGLASMRKRLTGASANPRRKLATS